MPVLHLIYCHIGHYIIIFLSKNLPTSNMTVFNWKAVVLLSLIAH